MTNSLLDTRFRAYGHYPKYNIEGIFLSTHQMEISGRNAGVAVPFSYLRFLARMPPNRVAFTIQRPQRRATGVAM